MGTIWFSIGSFPAMSRLRQNGLRALVLARQFRGPIAAAARNSYHAGMRKTHFSRAWCVKYASQPSRWPHARQLPWLIASNCKDLPLVPLECDHVGKTLEDRSRIPDRAGAVARVAERHFGKKRRNRPLGQFDQGHATSAINSSTQTECASGHALRSSARASGCSSIRTAAAKPESSLRIAFRTVSQSAVLTRNGSITSRERCSSSDAHCNSDLVV